MVGLGNHRLLDAESDHYSLQDYKGAKPRWCPGCGDNTILNSVQKLCHDEQLAPEKTVFISGIGCSSRFPHYMGTYGFHGLHGRALPLAQGIKIRRPDLHVFVNMGDGDCCSIGTAHWIHAIRYNMNMVAMVHDNEVYGMTKMQVSPTSPQGLKTNTTPYGAPLQPLNMLSTTLGVTNVSFVANVVDWTPKILYEILQLAFHHHGFAFIRILQRCPHFLPNLLDPLLQDRDRILILTHPDGLQLDDKLAKRYTHHEEHDPANIHRAREIAVMEDQVPIGILYRNEHVECYDELRKAHGVITPAMRKEVLGREFDRFAVNAITRS